MLAFFLYFLSKKDTGLFFCPFVVSGATFILYYSFSIHFRDHLAIILNVPVGFLSLFYLFFSDLACSFFALLVPFLFSLFLFCLQREQPSLSACILLVLYLYPTCIVLLVPFLFSLFLFCLQREQPSFFFSLFIEINCFFCLLFLYYNNFSVSLCRYVAVLKFCFALSALSALSTKICMRLLIHMRLFALFLHFSVPGTTIIYFLCL